MYLSKNFDCSQHEKKSIDFLQKIKAKIKKSCEYRKATDNRYFKSMIEQGYFKDDGIQIRCEGDENKPFLFLGLCIIANTDDSFILDDVQYLISQIIKNSQLDDLLNCRYVIEDNSEDYYPIIVDKVPKEYARLANDGPKSARAKRQLEELGWNEKHRKSHLDSGNCNQKTSNWS